MILYAGRIRLERTKKFTCSRYKIYIHQNSSNITEQLFWVTTDHNPGTVKSPDVSLILHDTLTKLPLPTSYLAVESLYMHYRYQHRRSPKWEASNEVFSDNRSLPHTFLSVAKFRQHFQVFPDEWSPRLLLKRVQLSN